MKIKVRIKLAVLAGAILFAIPGCRKSDLSERLSVVESVSLQEAQKIYSASADQLLHNHLQGRYALIRPDWKASISYSKGARHNALYIPMAYDPATGRTLQWVVMKDSGFVHTILSECEPDINYFKKSGVKDAKNVTGILTFYTITGFAKRKVRVTNGKVVQDLSSTLPAITKSNQPGARGGGNDSDDDGVENDFDDCPGTPLGVFVGPDGCPLQREYEAFFVVPGEPLHFVYYFVFPEIKPFDSEDEDAGESDGYPPYQIPYYEYTEAIVVDSLVNLCLKNVKTTISSLEIQGVITRLFAAYYTSKQATMTLKLIEDNTINDGHGNSVIARSDDGNGSNVWTIRLNPDYASTVSQEALASAFVHEIVHSFVNFYQSSGIQTTDPDTYAQLSTQQGQHTFMIVNFTEQIAEVLRDAYGLSPEATLGLALDGYDDVFGNSNAGYKSAWKSYVAGKYGIQYDSLNNEANKYFVPATGSTTGEAEKGTVCH